MRLTNDRYEVIKKSVVKMFVDNDIRQIPIDCFEICQKMCIKLRKYSQLTSDDSNVRWFCNYLAKNINIRRHISG